MYIYVVDVEWMCEISKRCFGKVQTLNNRESLFDGLNVSLCCYLLMRSESVEEEGLSLYIYTSIRPDKSSQLV